MRRLLALAALAALLSVPAAAQAAKGKIYQNLIGAANNLITFPAEPIMHIIEPPNDFEEMPGAVVTSRFMGLFSGTAMMIYRVTGAVYDIVVAPFYIFPVLSPEPRWEIIPGAAYE